jgi:preprotein translocase subunit SecA
MNKQREIIYGQRRQILGGFSLKENIIEIIYKLVEDYLQIYNQSNSSEVDIAGLISSTTLKFGCELNQEVFANQSSQEIKDGLSEALLEAYETKEKSIGEELMRNLERMVFLQIIDAKWKDHLYAMDNLREGIGLRAYGQRDPLIEYKREAFEMFGQMVSAIEEDPVETIFKLQPAKPERLRGVFSSLPKEFSHPEVAKFEIPAREESDSQIQTALQKPPVHSARSNQPKVGRNDPCPCGSGKKFKKCCAK